MQREKSTCLSPTKTTLVLFCSCSLETLDPRDFQTSARSSTRSNHREQNMQSNKREQLRTNNTPIKKRLKKEQGMVLGTQTQETLRTIERFELYHTRLCDWYILIQ
jgi:hypothetical protein